MFMEDNASYLFIFYLEFLHVCVRLTSFYLVILTYTFAFHWFAADVFLRPVKAVKFSYKR